MIAGPPYEMVYQYWPVFEDAFWRFRMAVAQHPQARVTSWYRDHAKNASVGGAPRSQHLLALAFDVVLPESQIEGFVETCRWMGLHPVRERDHVHVQRYEAGLLPARLFRGE